MILPAEAHPLLFALCSAFSYPTFDRFATLMAAAVLTPGRRTVANLLRTLGPLAHGHPTTYQRVLSCASWSGLCLGLLLARFLLGLSASNRGSPADLVQLRHRLRVDA
jgi:hypothetical protein